MEVLVLLILGFAIGFAACKVEMELEAVGTLKFNTSDPDGPYLFLELDNPNVMDLAKNKYVTMKVDFSPE